MAQIIVICCPSVEHITEHDKQEIYNLLEFKKRLKEFQKDVDKQESV